MSWSNHRMSRHIALAGSLALVITACTGGGATPSPSADEPAPTTAESAASAAASATAEASASAGAAVDLSGAEFTVGSKEFTEQLILGQITIQLLEDAGATVTDETGLVGSSVVREALTQGDIDMYWEYTGTGWITHQGNDTPIPGAQEQFDAVKEADAANDIAWLDPAPFNNTYAIAVASETGTELGIATMSDLAAYANENPEGATVCGASEWLNRDDGLPGLEAAYKFEFSEVSELELGLVYTSTAAGDPCVFGEAFLTDSRLVANDLTVLEDDLDFHPTYLPALNVRQEVLDENPGLADLFAPVAEVLDDETMLGLNSQVDVDGEEPADVAEAFLTENGLVGG
ncbi:MAG: glycine betaine ABC transporter substrate-binding protein [Chloroflexi bacterium]|nr:glycine betaine ABC transporter substrate-binding protein [Chloroflexota bacterium]